MKALLGTCIIAVGIVASGLAIAQQAGPAESVNPKKHPNLANAQRLIEAAYQAIETAQKDNEFDMDGHASKAKGLLTEADHQLKQAAHWANKNEK